MSYIEEALAKARALAKQAKSQAGGMANYSGKPTTGGGINHAAPHMKAQAEGRRMFVGGLSYDTTDESLETYLCTKWPTEECKVKRDPEGKSRGFAFVTFPVLSILEDCFGAGPHWVDGKQVELRKVSPDGSSGASTAGSSLKRGLGGGGGVTRYGPGGSSNTRVFVGQAPGGRSRGLNDDISDDDLRTYFERYGTVTGIAQHRWEDSGRKKGFGYMEFEEYEAAQAALGIHTICGVELEVKQYQQGVPPHRGYTQNPQSAPRNTSQGAPVPTTYNPSGVSSEYGYGGSGNGNGGGYGYGSDAKRSRPDTQGGGAEPQVMDQMKTMMQMMQTMQQQMAQRNQPQPPVQSSSVGDQMLQMQQSMYAMMQAQYAANMGGQQPQASADTSAQQSGGGTSYPSAAAYQAAQQAQYASSGYGGYGSGGYGGSASSAPKPPGTDRY